MNSLFGVELPTAVNFVIAFVVVLLLIGAAAWLVRRLGTTNVEAAARGRQPRLAVIDSAAVDNRRKLVIIRRDNVEHLLMIGGPSDVVVETNIVRGATTARDAAPARNGNGEHARAMPLPDPDPWPLQPESMPTSVQPAPVMRGARPTAEEVQQWQQPVGEPVIASAPPLRAVRPIDPLAGLASELTAAAHAPQAEPAITMQPAAPPVAPAIVSPADQSLAEMAQRLEAALRRPAPPKMAVEAGTPRAAAAEPRISARGAPVAPKGGSQPKTQAQDNLEKEMASLLGRPGKT